MTKDELFALDEATCRCADGRMGILIRWGDTEAGIQVPGEQDIRWIPLERLRDEGHGALVEAAVNG